MVKILIRLFAKHKKQPLAFLILTGFFTIYLFSTLAPTYDYAVDVVHSPPVADLDYDSGIVFDTFDAKKGISSPFKVLNDIYYVGHGLNAQYFINTSAGGVLIDTGCLARKADLEKNLKALGVKSGDITHILLTHGHGDHSGVAVNFQSKGTMILLHESDASHLAVADDLPNCVYCCSKMGPLFADVNLSDGDSITVGDKTFSVIHFPGHTPGSAIYKIKYTSGQKHWNVLFTGDTFFGPTNYAFWVGNNYSNLTAFIKSFEKLDKIVADEHENSVYIIAPGHVFPHNPTNFQQSNKTEFRNNLKLIQKRIIQRQILNKSV